MSTAVSPCSDTIFRQTSKIASLEVAGVFIQVFPFNMNTVHVSRTSCLWPMTHTCSSNRNLNEYDQTLSLSPAFVDVTLLQRKKTTRCYHQDMNQGAGIWVPMF